MIVLVLGWIAIGICGLFWILRSDDDRALYWLCLGVFVYFSVPLLLIGAVGDR